MRKRGFRIPGITGGSRTLKLTMEPSTSSWRVCQFHHGDVMSVPTEGFEPSQHTVSETAASTKLGHVGKREEARFNGLRRRIRTFNLSDPNGTLCQVEPCAGSSWTRSP